MRLGLRIKKGELLGVGRQTEHKKPRLVGKMRGTRQLTSNIAERAEEPQIRAQPSAPKPQKERMTLLREETALQPCPCEPRASRLSRRHENEPGKKRDRYMLRKPRGKG